MERRFRRVDRGLYKVHESKRNVFLFSALEPDSPDSICAAALELAEKEFVYPKRTFEDRYRDEL